jgi:hypothetical protein
MTNIKSKAVPLHAVEALWGEEYSSYSFTTSALDGVGGQRHAPSALYPQGQDPRYPLDPVSTQRVEEKSFGPDGVRAPIARRLARRKTLYWLSYPDD